jgi:hypothetical protein
MHLQRAQSEVVGKCMAVHNKFRALFDRNTAYGFVCFRYNDRKVLRSQKRWHGSFNLVKPFFEPRCRFFQPRERICLPSQQGNTSQHVVDIKSPDETKDRLGKPSADIIECPGALSEIRAKWMSEIVVPDDVSQRVHPTLQPAIDQFSDPGNVVGPYFTFGCVSLFSLATEENDIQFDKVQVFESLLDSESTELIESGIKPLQVRLKQQKASGREILRDDDFGKRSLGVKALRNNDCWNLGNLSGQSPECCSVLHRLVGGNVDCVSRDILYPCRTKFDRIDWV